MITNISYNVLIERFRAFADGHYLIRGFTHGDPSNVNLEKGVEFPWMHVFPVEVEPRAGSRLYSFIITFADLPRDKETPPEYQREMLSDCIRLAEDLLAEIQNGLVLFGPTVELDGSASIECFINEFSHTLTGVNLSLTLSVPWDWSACDIPADWSVGGSGSGGTGGGGGGSGTVTSVGLTAPAAFNVSGSPVTTSGTLAISAAGNSGQYIDGSGNLQTFPTIPAAQVNSDWNAVSGVAEILNKPTIPTELDDLSDVNAPSPTNGQVLTWNGSAWINSTPATGGTVTSVGLTMPSAFAVTGSPVTSAGTLAVTGAGTTGQYIRGDGTLANFPSTGGGGGQIFYFNGNISQGTIGGNAFYELGTAANTGPAANFTRATTGVIARFITDVGEPNHLIIPSGVWTIDVYLSETGGGSNNAEIIAVLKVYNGATFTTIASSPLEQITNGNVIDLYTFAISVPNTITAASDRVVIEFDIQNTNGKTVTLYTEDGRIGEVHTTYAIGLSSLNGLTASTQTFATGTAGTDFGINSAGSVHTFNLPTASASNRGALSSADWTSFNNKQNSIGLTTVGTNLATLPDPSAIRYLRINADNTVSALTLAALKMDLGLGTAFLSGDVATSGTAWQDITGLTFAVTAGKTYKWRATIPYTVTSGNINFAISGPTLTITRYRFTAAATGTTNFVNNQTSYDTGTLVAGVNGCATSDGVIRCSANGTVAMRMRSSVSGALTALIGSIVEFEEVV